jgi:hypothetical protein
MMVIRELTSSIAIIIKRWWGDMNQQTRESILGSCWSRATPESIAASSSPPSSSSAVVITVSLLSALVEAFAASSSMAMCNNADASLCISLPLEYHVHCHIAFQDEGYLFFIFRLSATLMAHAYNKGDQALLKPTLNLVLDILAWNFDRQSLTTSLENTRKAHSLDSDNNDSDDSNDELCATLACTGEQWQALVAPMFDSPATETLHYLCFRIFEAVGSDALLVTLAGRVLTRLAGVGKQLFVSEHHRTYILSLFLREIAQMIPRYVEPVRGVLLDASVLLMVMRGSRSRSTTHAWLSIAQVIRRLFSNFSGRDLWTIPELAISFLDEMTTFTCTCVSGQCGEVDKAWYSDIFSHLLVAWLSLATLGMVISTTIAASTAVHCSEHCLALHCLMCRIDYIVQTTQGVVEWYSCTITNCSWKIFECYVASRLIIAKQEVLCDDDGG